MSKSPRSIALGPALVPTLPEAALAAPSQYLKIPFSSKRRLLLQRLASALGCSWQSIALNAIDELLDRETSPKTHV